MAECKWLELAGIGWKCMKTAVNCWNWMEMDEYGWKRCEIPGYFRTLLEQIRTSEYLKHSSYQWLKKVPGYDGNRVFPQYLIPGCPVIPQSAMFAKVVCPDHMDISMGQTRGSEGESEG